MKRIAALGAAAVVVVALGALTPAFSSGGEHRHHFRVVEIMQEQQFVDTGPQGESLGDMFVFSSHLFRHHEKVGHLGVVCTFVSSDPAVAQCQATAEFRGGQIAVQGLVPDQGTRFVLPVTGGSGRYEGAAGEVHVRQVSDTKEILTFHLRG